MRFSSAHKCAILTARRGQAGRDALREMRRSFATAYRELRPQAFGEWLREREEQRERVRPTADRWQRHEQTVTRDRHERGASGDFSRADEVAQSSWMGPER